MGEVGQVRVAQRLAEPQPEAGAARAVRVEGGTLSDIACEDVRDFGPRASAQPRRRGRGVSLDGAARQSVEPLLPTDDVP